jgi:hypothetical protein
MDNVNVIWSSKAKIFESIWYNFALIFNAGNAEASTFEKPGAGNLQTRLE